MTNSDILILVFKLNSISSIEFLLNNNTQKFNKSTIIIGLTDGQQRIVPQHLINKLLLEKSTTQYIEMNSFNTNDIKFLVDTLEKITIDRFNAVNSGRIIPIKQKNIFPCCRIL